MKTNVGTADRIVRITVGLGILAAGFHFKNWLGLVGLLPMLTAVVGICPAYVPFGLNTCRAQSPRQEP